MSRFEETLAEIKRECAWENIPYDRVSALARLCGPAEVDRLIKVSGSDLVMATDIAERLRKQELRPAEATIGEDAIRCIRSSDYKATCPPLQALSAYAAAVPVAHRASLGRSLSARVGSSLQRAR